jgi:hypothetical protein
MRIYGERTVPARVERFVKCATCDICHEEIPRVKDTYETSEVEVRLKEGRDYPEGGSGEETEIDVCPDCFKTKLIPFIESFGSTIKPTEYDW